MGCSMRASRIAALLNLQPHPEGGYYKETLRDSSIHLNESQLPPHYKVERPVSSSIYFLLPSGSVTYLHRIPCAEVLHFYMGEPFTIFQLTENGQFKLSVLGPDLEAGQHLQYTVPPLVWFGFYPTKDIESYASDGSSITKSPPRDADLHFTLSGCTCAPAFQFDDNEVATLSQVLPLCPKAEAFLRLLTPAD
ncbi:hypothetical protein EJ110_NYTH00466 [Nymphaea thermarum]|nr:hypothetical protein EJ110_NYTH00466 [Nymphaea thermarum]